MILKHFLARNARAHGYAGPAADNARQRRELAGRPVCHGVHAEAQHLGEAQDQVVAEERSKSEAAATVCNGVTGRVIG